MEYELGGVAEPTEVVAVEEIRDNTVRKGVGWEYTLRVTTQDGQVLNDGIDTETVTITVVDGLEIARGTDPADATVLDYDGDMTVTVDGVETAKTLTKGSVSFDVTTEKQAGSTIEVVAESLADYPAESDSAEIEVISP